MSCADRCTCGKAWAGHPSPHALTCPRAAREECAPRFWTDLGEDMRDPEFRATYEQEDEKVRSLDHIAEMTAARTKADDAAWNAKQDWEAAVRWALLRDCPASKVAEAAGISKARVYQIRDGRR